MIWKFWPRANGKATSGRLGFIAAAGLALLLAASLGHAGPPQGYYDSAEGKTGSALKSALTNIISGHSSLSYNAAKTRLWADVDNRGGYVQCLYSGRISHSLQRDTDGMNAEHTWPQSRGAGSVPRRSDLHHLFVADSEWNAIRSSFKFENINNPEDTSPTGSKIDPSVGFEPGGQAKGYIARACFYFHVRYGYPLIENATLGGSNSTTSDDNMGRLSTLLEWHEQYPPDNFERTRNDRIYGIQHNRNPFIDRPEFACLMFSGVCNVDFDPPGPPFGLFATGATGAVNVDWIDNPASDLAGYNIYRATNHGGPYTRVNTELLTSSDYQDTNVIAAIEYCYVATAVDENGNESSYSNEDCASPLSDGGGSSSGAVWINEFHYDNAGGDINEFVEIAGPAGTDLAGWSVAALNGTNGSQYDSITLNGVIPDQQNCFGTLAFPFPNLQNGGPDGLVLVDGQGGLVQFLSYEGTFTATASAANGTTSTDVGVAETNADPAGLSLQLSGSGVQPSDFGWEEPAAETPGQLNNNQTFTGVCGGGEDTDPPAAPTFIGAIGGNAEVLVDWADNAEPDLAGYNIYQATSASGPWTQLNGAPLAASDYFDTAVTNGTTYYYYVTAVDETGNESDPSNVAEATPMDDSIIEAPGLLIAVAGNGEVLLDWPDNTDATLDGYNLYRAEDMAGPWTKQNASLLTASDYFDTNVVNGTTYYYVVTALNMAGNESNPSNVAEATPMAPGNNAGGEVWINEFHYDDSGSDDGEFIEIAGPSDTSVEDWTIVGYNGSTGAAYATIDLAGVIPDQGNCYGTLAFDFPEMQNGAPDAIALVDSIGRVIQFLSYEGVMTATDGPATGLTSVDIGQSEGSGTVEGDSLQLSGAGSVYADFAWQAPSFATRGQFNTGQTITGGCGAGVPDIMLDPAMVTAPDPAP